MGYGRNITPKVGELNGRSKFTYNQVLWIRRVHIPNQRGGAGNKSKYSTRGLAEHLGVSQHAIRDIVNLKSYAWRVPS